MFGVAVSSITRPGCAAATLLALSTFARPSEVTAFSLSQSRSAASRARMNASGQGGGAHRYRAKSLRELADLYDAFLIDQWGVMHDGHQAYPGAVECVKELAKAGKKLILLSNSSKRQAGSLRRLEQMGFASSDYVACITSGQLTFDGLKERSSSFFQHIKGSKVLILGNDDDDHDYVTSLGCEPAPVARADFLLARGPFAIVTDPDPTKEVRRFGPNERMHESEDFRSLAERAIARGLPMVVSNPDIVRPGGNNDPMPGVLGQFYADMGGTTYYVGKPHPLVYEHCAHVLGGQGHGLRVCAVGDSMFNDILGAHREGLASILVTDGIHADALGVEQGGGGEVIDERLERFLQSFDYRPTHIVPRFRW